jgi:small subunit ribosomal protein S19e
LPTAYDVEANALVERLARHLKENVGDVTPPAWSITSKTGAHRERPPQNPDWWYVRCASLLRKLYVHGSVGTERLRVEYGGRKRKGTSREHMKDSGGSAIREPLQQLEKAGLIAKEGSKGRKLSGEGVSLVNRIAAEILKSGSSGEGSKQ